jgi:hypothetical protein
MAPDRWLSMSNQEISPDQIVQLKLTLARFLDYGFCNNSLLLRQ